MKQKNKKKEKDKKDRRDKFIEKLFKIILEEHLAREKMKKKEKKK